MTIGKTYKELIVERAKAYEAESRDGLAKLLKSLQVDLVGAAVIGATNSVTHNQICWIMLAERFLFYASDENEPIDNEKTVHLLINIAFESCVRSHPHLALSMINAKMDMSFRVLQEV